MARLDFLPENCIVELELINVAKVVEMNEEKFEQEIKREILFDKIPSEINFPRKFIETIKLSEKSSKKYLTIKTVKNRLSRFLLVFDHRKESVEKVEELGLPFDIEINFEKISKKSELIETLNKPGSISIRRKIYTNQETSPPYVVIKDDEISSEEALYFFPAQLFSYMNDIDDLSHAQKTNNRILALLVKNGYWSIIKKIGNKTESIKIQFGIIPLRY